MKKRHFNRRAILVVLCLALALAVVLGGAYQGTEKAAGLPLPSISITLNLHLLVASDFTPADGSTEVALGVSPSVKFNYNLAAGVLSSSTFYIQKAGSATKLPASISYSSVTDRATLNPTSDLLPGTMYHVTVTSGIEDEDGFNLFNPKTWSFTTDTAPLVISRDPSPNELNVPIDKSVSVTFSKRMNTATINSTSFWVKEQGGSKVTGTILSSIDKKTVVFNPTANLKAGTVYEVTMTSAVESEAGITAFEVGATYLFKTAENAPALTARSPVALATGVAVDQSITATFDKTMDAATLTSATFYVAKMGGSPLPATVTYDAASKTATLNPLADFEGGATYTVTLSNAVTGNGGVPLSGAPVTWTFTTVSAAPTVTTKVPASGAGGVALTQAITATFDKNMDATTLTSATFYVAKLGGSPLPATVAYDAGSKTATLDPLADLDAGATYQVTLSSAIKGADSQTLAGSPVTWTFSTAASSSSFSDVIPGVTPYSTAIAALAAEGIITGFPDGTFRPYDFVTRQQFAKMIVLTMGYPVTGAEVCPFTDVVTQSGTDPFYPSKYVAVCATRGITTGKTPTTFAPYETITHQQLITMVVRAAAVAMPPVAYTPPFTAAQFSLETHYLNARMAAYAGLLNDLLGVGPAYSFLAGSTRGECAQLLYNLSVLMGS